MSTVKLQSADGVIFNLDIELAKQSGTITTLLDECGSDGELTFPLRNMNSDLVRRVIEYIEHHKDDVIANESDCDDDDSDDDDQQNDDISFWDRNFLSVDQVTLFDLLMSAQYLDITGLKEITSKMIASMIEGKTANQILQIFDIRNDKTPSGWVIYNGE